MDSGRDKYWYAKDNLFSVENSPVPSEYENKIICGDSLQELKKLPDNCIDIIFTSPPYNFDMKYDVCEVC